MKEKKKKVKVEGGKKWAVWKTVVVVVSSVFAVSGASVLGVYFTGGFNKSKINPNDIFFTTDDLLYNQSNNQFEVTEDFFLTINTTTEHVTETNVRLSFSGAFDRIGSSISDRVITVPEYVQIGVPFKVTLNTSKLAIDDAGNTVDWISGGISNLTASSQSSNLHIESTSVQIAVDVPVYSVETVLCDMNGNQFASNQVVVGSNFQAKNIYYPSNSAYLYSDNNAKSTVAEKRERQSYFVAESQHVTFVYSEEYMPYFRADQTSLGNKITGYTFTHANDQIETINSLSEEYSGNELYGTILTRLTQNSSMSKNDTNEFEIVRASIGNFNVPISTLPTIQSGQSFTLTVNGGSDFADASLNASVLSTGNEELDVMKKNIGIRFLRGDTEVNQEFTVIGGEKVIVEETVGNVISQKNYILPNSSVANFNFSSWEIFTRVYGTYSMEVVLLVEDAEIEGKYNIFSVGNSQQKFNLELRINELVESDLVWNIEDFNMNLKLKMDESNPQNPSTIPIPISLDGNVSVPANNVNKDLRYFLRFDGVNGKNDLEKAYAIVDKDDLDVDRAGVYSIGIPSYFVPLKNLNFKAIGEGQFTIHVATVLSGLNGIEYTPNGQYTIAKGSNDAIKVNVSKSLHQGSITSAQISTNKEFDQGKNVYIYEGDAESSITISFKVAGDSVLLVKEALASQNIDLNNLRIYSGSEDLTLCFNKTGVQLNEETQTLDFYLKVNNIFGFNGDKTITHAQITDTSSDIVWNLGLTAENDNAVVIYKPSIASATISVGEEWTNYVGKEIKVKQTLTTDGNFESKIFVGEEGFNKDDFVAGLKSAIIIEDQHEDRNTLSGWEFKSSNACMSANGKEINFAGNGNAELSVWFGSSKLDIATLKFVVESVGIQSYQAQTEEKISETKLSDVQTLSDANRIAVSKFGASGGEIDLKDLIKLYTDAEGTSTSSFENFLFSFDFSRMTDDDIIALFGKNGMITVDSKTQTTDDAEEIRTSLAGEINSLKINHNFASSAPIYFTVHDARSVFSISFTLTITQNIAINGDGEIDNYAKVSLGNLGDYAVTYNDNIDNLPNNLKAFLTTTTRKYILPTDYTKSLFELSDKSENEFGSAVGEVDVNGNVIFNDFWDEPNKSFAVRFCPEIDNIYAIEQTIRFDISRNVFVSKKANFNLLNATQSISNYINLTRVDGSEISDVSDEKISYRFIGNVNELTINGGNVSLGGNQVSFDYNEKVKNYKIEVSIDGNSVGEADFVVELGVNYSDLASKLSVEIGNEDKTILTASTLKTSENGSEREYIYLPWVASSWTFDSSLDTEKNFSTTVVMLDGNHSNINYHKATDKYSIYENRFLAINNNQVTNALYGLDNQSSYMIFKVSNRAGTEVASVVMPMIVSRVNANKEFVRYSNSTVAEKVNSDNLKYALMDKEELKENEIYEEVSAGREVQIVWADDNTKIAKQGFIFNDELFSSVSRSLSVVEGEELVNYIDNNSGIILLNHLEKNQVEQFVVIKFTILHSGNPIELFYRLKVKPDVIVEKTKYAFDGVIEYFTADENNNLEVALDAQFKEETLHNGEYRFSVTDLEGNKIEGIKYRHEFIVSIEGENWEDVIDRVYIDSSSVLRVEGIRTQKEINITIKRIYDVGNNNNGLSIVGGEAEYNIVINSKTQYAVTYPDAESGKIDMTINGNNAEVNIKATAGDFVFDEKNVNSEKNYIKIEGATLNGADAQQDYFLSKKDTSYYRWTDKQVYDSTGTAITDTKASFVTEISNIKNGFVKFESGKYLKVDDADNVEPITNYSVNENGQYVFNKNTAIYVKNGNAFEIAENVKLKNGYLVDRTFSIKVTLNNVENNHYEPINNLLFVAEKVKTGEEQNEKIFVYDDKTGTLTMKMPKYVSQQSEKVCLLYTEYGLIGEVTFNISSTYQVELKKDVTTNAGTGNVNVIGNYIDKITKNGETFTDVITVKEVEIPTGESRVTATADGNLTFYSSIADYNVSLKVTLQIGEDEDNIVIFNLPINVSANIKNTKGGEVGTMQDNAEIKEMTILAGTESGILGTFSGILLEGEKAKYMVSSDDSTVIEGKTVWDGFEFTANPVGNDGQTVTLTIDTYIYKNMLSKDEPQVFRTIYRVKVVCNGLVTTAYPNPTGAEKGDFTEEYIEASVWKNPTADEQNPAQSETATYASAQDFFDGKAVFAENPRVTLTQINQIPNLDNETANADSKNVKLNANNTSIKITSIVNAIVRQESALVTAEEGKNGIDLSKKLEFFRETTNNVQSKITFQITFNGFEIDYQVVLVDDAFSLVVNSATNTTSINDGVVSETFFIENMSGNGNIFAENRMAKFTLSRSAIQGDFMAVFGSKITDADGKVTSVTESTKVAFSVKEEDQGKTIVLDNATEIIGEYIGTYRVNSDLATGHDEIDLTNQIYSTSGVMQKTSRIVLTYNGVEVAYDMFGTETKLSPNANETTPTLPDETEQPDTASDSSATEIVLKDFNIGSTAPEDIDKAFALKDFNFSFNDGSEKSKLFGLSYEYKLTLDIAGASAEGGNFQIYTDLQVEKSVDLFDIMNIRKASTNERITNLSEQVDGANVSVSVLGTYEGQTQTTANEDSDLLSSAVNFMSNRGTPSSLSLGKTSGYPYLRVSPVRTSDNSNNTSDNSKNIISWQATGMGASNDGNYVLVKLEYSATINSSADDGTTQTSENVTEYKKTFCMIIQVVPAYRIKLYNTNTTSALGTTPSNSGGVMHITGTGDSNDSSQQTVNLTGETISITKINASESGKTNLANTFKYTLVYDKVVGNLKYNEKLNLQNKTNIFDPDNEYNWSENGKPEKEAYKSGDISIVFTEAKFGDKYFMFEAEDNYGYKFNFFLTLDSKTTPNATGDQLALTEGGKFDIGVQANYVSATEVGTENGKKQYSLSAENQPINAGTNNNQVVNISGLSSIMNFFVSQQELKNVLDGGVSSSDGKYLICDYNNIKITFIQFMVGDKSVGSIKNLNEALKTNGGYYRVGNDKTPLPATSITDDLSFTVPSITDSSYWNGGNNFDATMHVTLTYTDSDNKEEVFTLPVSVNITRNVNIEQAIDNYFYEGEDIDLVDHLNVKSTVDETTVSLQSVINDTLEVTIPANSTVDFYLQVFDSDSYSETNPVYDNKQFITDESGNRVPDTRGKRITRSNTTGSPKTEYIFISEEMGKDLKQGNLIKVTTSQESDTYNNSNNSVYNSGYMFGVRNFAGGTWKNRKSDTTQDNVTTYSWEVIAQAKSLNPKDRITFASAGNLKGMGTNPVPVQRSYIVTIQKGNDTNNTSSYRYKANYNITWKYTDKQGNLGDMKISGAIQTTGNNYTATWENLIANIKFYRPDIVGDLVNSKVEITDTINFLDFKVVIDKDGTGFAKIDGNGTLKTEQGFNNDQQYITLVFYRKVSGGSDDHAVEDSEFIRLRITGFIPPYTSSTT